MKDTPKERKVDPLETSKDEGNTTKDSSAPAVVERQLLDPNKDYTAEELQEILSQPAIVDMENERMDPLEWSFRKVVPIPAQYYWDVLPNENEEKRKALEAKIPRKIKVWHKTIAALDVVQHWTTKRVAEPIASATGITGSKFHFVTDQMTKEDMQQSKRFVVDRQKRDKSISKSKKKKGDLALEE